MCAQESLITEKSNFIISSFLDVYVTFEKKNIFSNKIKLISLRVVSDSHVLMCHSMQGEAKISTKGRRE